MRPFRYCPRCGIELGDGGRCPRCGELVVPRVVPAVGMAVVESGSILLVRRRWEPMVGHWALPAGFIEGHEAPATGARREVAEETGLLVRPTGLLGAFPGGGPGGRILLLVYRGVVEGGRLEAGDDATEAGFFALDAPPEPLAFGPHRRVLELLRAETSA
jgi:ADP-ribose pyrophosphatase YjhB (NUDIX family)